MYEYKCSNTECNKVWTIEEGNIGTLYLTCPYCKKGLGRYLKQVKDRVTKENQDKPSNDNKIIDEEIKEQIEKKEKGVVQSNQEIKSNTISATDKIDGNDNKDLSKNNKNIQEQVSIDEVLDENQTSNENQNTQQEQGKHNIIDIIKRKRQHHENFTRDIDEEDVDTLEITGSSIKEIEKRIKEFEEYYYIKVLDKSIEQHGNRYNCIIKYTKK